MSGAGKSTALKILEDAGYFCVDNLPIPLLEKFAQFIVEGNSGSIQKVALGVDVRSGGGMEGVEKALEEIRLTGLEYEILFLDAEDEVLVKRYKETRRTHPLAGSGRVENGIREERRRLKYLKEHADEYHIDPEKIVVQGCSAGGHLAANYGIAWNSPFLTKLMGMENDPERLCVAGLLLCYPVITSGEKAHEESFRNLLGEQYEEKKEELSLENQVTPDTPPTFLWHTATDETVPVENSLYFFQACLQQGVSAELHIYPVGGHGLSLANEETCRANGIGVQKECQSWIGLAQTWLEEMLIKN